jgi:hypothetical protein
MKELLIESAKISIGPCGDLGTSGNVIPQSGITQIGKFKKREQHFVV